MRLHGVIQPGFVVEAHRIDYQRVAIPAAYRVAEPGRRPVPGMIAVRINPAYTRHIDVGGDHQNLFRTGQPEKAAYAGGIPKYAADLAYRAGIIGWPVGFGDLRECPGPQVRLDHFIQVGIYRLQASEAGGPFLVVWFAFLKSWRDGIKSRPLGMVALRRRCRIGAARESSRTGTQRDHGNNKSCLHGWFSS